MGTLLENRDTQRQRLAVARSTVHALHEQINATEAKCRSAERTGSSTALRHRNRLADLTGHLVDAQQEQEAAKRSVEQAEQQLHEARLCRRITREFDAFALLGAPPDLQQRVDWGDGSSLSAIHWELQLLETDADGQKVTVTDTDRDGATHSAFKERFGYRVTVYGPHRDLRGNWQTATVNWSTLGTVSVQDARDLIRVHTYGVDLAAWLDARRDAWHAEDMAD